MQVGRLIQTWVHYFLKTCSLVVEMTSQVIGLRDILWMFMVNVVNFYVFGIGESTQRTHHIPAERLVLQLHHKQEVSVVNRPTCWSLSWKLETIRIYEQFAWILTLFQICNCISILWLYWNQNEWKQKDVLSFQIVPKMHKLCFWFHSVPSILNKNHVPIWILKL